MTSLPSRPTITSYGTFLERVNDACRPVLGNHETTAAAVVTSGPPPYPLIWLPALAGSALAGLIAAFGHAGPEWAGTIAVVVPGIGALLPAAFQRTMLLAVADGQLLVSRWSTRRHRASDISLAPASIATVRVRRRRRTTTIVLEGLGTGPIRLHAVKAHRAELDGVLNAAYTAGALIADAAIA